MKYLQTKLAIPAFNKGFPGRMGICPILPTKTKVFGSVVDITPILVDVYINQCPCESTHTPFFFLSQHYCAGFSFCSHPLIHQHLALIHRHSMQCWWLHLQYHFWGLRMRLVGFHGKFSLLSLPL